MESLEKDICNTVEDKVELAFNISGEWLSVQ